MIVFRAKKWSFTTTTNLFTVSTEGEACGVVELAARIMNDMAFESDPGLAMVQALQIRVPGTPRAGDTIQARLYVDGEEVDRMSICVTGATCPRCGCEFTL